MSGTAVHLYDVPGVAPPSLVTSVRTHHVLHERVLVASILTEDVPRVPPAERIEHTVLSGDVEQVLLHYGFLDVPQVADDLHEQLGVDPADTTYLVGREAVVVTDLPGMAQWREHLFGALRRNAANPAAHFGLPNDQVVELTTQVEM